MTSRLRRAATLALAAGLLSTASGCGRRAHVEYPAGDSLGTAGVDSALVAVREAQQAWDAAGGGEAAAGASAHALRLTLATTPPERWSDRAQEFLDSLGVGGETAAGEGALAVNFFSRSDPSSGSWPYLFWTGAHGPEFQALEGRSMRLLRLVTRGMRSAPGVRAPSGKRDTVIAAAAVLFDRRAALGTEPFLMMWMRRGAGWVIGQSLGPDSLGGAGTAEFEPRGDSLHLVTRTYRASRGFEECPNCPHVYRVRRFAWARDGFVRQSDEEFPSPYSTFVRFVQALLANDVERASRFVTDAGLAEAARDAGFGQSKGLWRVAPATDETATHMVFLRGATESYDVGFSQHDGEWLIERIQVAERGSE